MIYRDKYLENIQNVLKGTTANMPLDTTQLNVPKDDKTED